MILKRVARGTSSSRIEVERLLEQFARALTASSIATSFERLTKAEEGATAARVLASANGFDFLPVLSGDDVMGLVEVRRLRECAPGDRIASDLVLPLRECALADELPLSDLVDHLARREAFLLQRGRACVGLVHFSDLNRHAVQTFAYVWLSALELNAAEVVSRECSSNDELLSLLPERRRRQATARLEEQRKHDVEIDLVETLDLTDLLRVVARKPSLVEELDLTGREFRKRRFGVITLRNAAMHPVRPLVRSHGDVSRLAERLRWARDLIDRFGTRTST